MRYVIQKHTHRNNPTHWDLMLEQEKKLTTYRINTPPENFTAETIEAKKINDHPMKFLTYQGPVNKGLGNVEIADSGKYSIISQKQNQMTISFKGKLLNNICHFTQR